MNLFKKLSSLLILTFLLAIGSTFNVHASGFGVSGSFSSYHYKIVPGETILTPNINVIFFNNYDVDIEVEITANGPDGISFILDDTIVSIEANDTLDIPIGIVADENTVPGEYTLGISARVLPTEAEGISVVGAAELRTNLSVFGEAGDLTIKTVDLDGLPFEGEIRLFRVEGQSIQPVDQITGDSLSNRYVPATYRVFVYYQNRLVAEEDIILNNEDNLVETIFMQTLFIEQFNANPLFNASTEAFTSARLSYQLNNIYTEINDIYLDVDVSFDGTYLETYDASNLSRLISGEFGGNFVYVPSNNWQAGLYEFELIASVMRDGEKIEIARSRIRAFDVPESAVSSEEEPEPEPEPEPEEPAPGLSTGMIVLIAIASTLAVIGLALFILWFIIFKKREDEEDELDEKDELDEEDPIV